MAFLLGIFGMLPFRTWLVIGGVAVLLAGTAYMYHSIEQAGEQRAIQRVNDANRKSEEKADTNEDAVAACYRNLGSWDRIKRVCVSAPTR